MSADTARRLLIVCPGRGSYTKDCLGSLQGAAAQQSPGLAAADRLRASLGRPGPTELDAAPEYRSALHVAGENASILTAAATLADVDALRSAQPADQQTDQIVAVIGNSMGWYTALAVAGALPLDQALHLIETMGQYQAGNVIGGQMVYPLVDAEWRPLPSPELAQALTEVPDLHWSIRLGGQAVIGGSEAALAELQRRLPIRRAGERDAPFRLPLHSAFHTPLMAETARRARRDLSGLRWRAPAITLIDGRGAILRPRHADPARIRDWTLGAQVTEVYDFTLSLRVALREYAPTHVVLPGPGGSLGGAVAQVIIAEGWQGIRSREAFARRQSEAPVLISMSRPEQRALLIGSAAERPAG